jgi:hypothetical protein
MMGRRLLACCAGAAFVLAAGVVFAAGILSLPPGPVTVLQENWAKAPNSTLDITLTGVPEGYDVTDGKYPGWCIEDNGQEDVDGLVTLLDSTDTEELMCGDNNYPGYPWDKVNYLLNNQGGTIKEVQAALWLLTDTYNGGFFGPNPPAAVWDMVNDANANGVGFLPAPGQIAAVVLCADGDTPGYGDQDTIIEVVVPPTDFQGCTPGYWKQEQHFLAWVPTGYIQTDLYGFVFDVDDTKDLELLQALRIGGGKENALYRHATAALLNAASPDVSYYYSVAQVIQMVQDAYRYRNFGYFKDILEDANEMGCPLGNEDLSLALEVQRGKGRKN